MLLFVSALAAFLLLLLALKLSERLTLRLKVLAGVTVGKQQKSCPHLGLAEDPFTHAPKPSEDHRCYLWMQRDRIDLVHQKGFCLTAAHHKCPWLTVRRPGVTPPLWQRLPSSGALIAGQSWALLVSGAGTAWRLVSAACTRIPGLGRRAGGGLQRCLERASVLARSRGIVARRVLVRAAVWLLVQGAQLQRALFRALLIGGRAAGRGLARVCSSVACSLGQAWAKREARPAASDLTPRKLVEMDVQVVPARVAIVEPANDMAISSVAAAPAPGPVPASTPAVHSLEQLEELLREGVAALDGAEEALAYHLFCKASACRPPAQAGAMAAQYTELLTRAWFWRAKTAETVEDVVHSLQQGLILAPDNLQMQAHLAWAQQRLNRERRLQSTPSGQPWTSQPTSPLTLSTSAVYRAPVTRPGGGPVVLDLIRMAGGFAALALAALWMTAGVFPALRTIASSLPAADQALLQRLILSINPAALPGKGHLPLPLLNYDLGLSLPFVLAFLFVFTARGLMDGDAWARGGSLLLAGLGGWLCTAAVTNADAGRLGVGLCAGMIVAAMLGRFQQHAVPGSSPEVLLPSPTFGRGVGR